MIVMQLCGGLGNQLFQYALGRRLSLEKKVPLLLDISHYQTEKPGVTFWPYRLDCFRIQAATSVDWQRDLANSFPPGTEIRVQGVKEQGDAFNPQAVACADNAYLMGYWQTEKYFIDIADQIRADFTLVEPMTAERGALAAQMAQGQSVSVHVRRGDYITNPNAAVFHGTCSPEWYAQAMGKMAAGLDHPRFFIFSDDPDWARANLPAYDGAVFVDPQSDKRDYQDMTLMSKCRNHIIANSSFSWWGAWLNSSPEKKVIAPARWFLVESDLRDRIPSSWMRL